MFRNLFKKKATDLVSPMKGKLVSLDEVNDPVFKERAIGDGFAIDLIEGNVYSPVSGEIVALFPTNHAIGIKSEDRNEYLVHIGLETVGLKGEGFKSTLAQGDQVKEGELLVEVDHEFFKEKSIDMMSPVVVTNLNGRKVELLKDGENVEVGTEDILRIFVP